MLHKNGLKNVATLGGASRSEGARSRAHGPEQKAITRENASVDYFANDERLMVWYQVALIEVRKAHGL